MKRFFALLLALCLCAGLCACGGGSEPEASQSQNGAENQEELYEKSGTMDDGTTFTTYRRGGPEGTKAKLIYDTPDGFHGEELYNQEGVMEYSIVTGSDGSSYETFYYPSGNMSKSITKNADGSYEEIHFLDNGYVDENGWMNSGTVSYQKTVSADGQVEEFEENMELQEDGTWWTTVEWEDGTVMRTHHDKNGNTIETHQDNEATGMHTVELYYENGNYKSRETRYDNSEEYRLTEFYENEVTKYSLIRSADGTEQEEKVTELGFTTYLRITHPQSETEFFGDDSGNLEKFVDNGKVYEGNAIPDYIRQTWDSFKTVHAPATGEAVTEYEPDGSYWKTTTYTDGKILRDHFNADDHLIGSETVEPNGDRYCVEYHENGNTKHIRQEFKDVTFEFSYDEEGYETYYHEYGFGREIEMITDETGKLVKVLQNGVELTDYANYIQGHNFRS